MDNNLYKRLARVEAIAEYQKAEFIDSLKSAYENACRNQNAEDAAMFARQIRNKLLNESDNRMAIDRLNLPVPNGSDFGDWLSFLKELGKTLTGEWAKYRQQLRNLPEQEGFPYNVEFPVKPNEITRED